jgi:hypothetical protein
VLQVQVLQGPSCPGLSCPPGPASDQAKEMGRSNMPSVKETGP